METYSHINVCVGGQRAQIDAVLLHSASAVKKWQELLAKAQPLLAGFSSGLAVIGSPGEALAGAAAIGFLEAAVSNANQKQAFKLLVEATEMHDRLKPRGIFVPVSEMQGVISPDVSAWKARGKVESEADVRSMGMFEKSRFRKEWGASDEEIKSGFVVRETEQDLIVLPDNFVTCRTGDRLIQVKWSSIDIYEAIA